MKGKTTILLHIALTILLVVADIACSTQSKSRSYAESCEITLPMDSVFTALFPPDAPGAMVTVMRGDSIVYSRSFGIADFARTSNVDSVTMFNICSVTKQFVAVALVKLDALGLLSLDDP